MTETQNLSWDEVDVTEEITETDQTTSNDLSTQTPVGKFVCTIIGCDAREKTLKAYTCIAANLRMRIDKVLQIEQKIFDKQNEPIKRNGEIVRKIQDVPAEKVDSVNALFVGQLIFDEINLFHPKEKAGMKKRRLFVAKKVGIMTPQATELKTSAWPGAVNRQIIVQTEWNHWEDKTTGEPKKNVKVAWSGYETAPGIGTVQPGTDFNPDEFDI